MLGGAVSPLPLVPGAGSSVGSGAFGGLQQPERMVGQVGGRVGGIPTILMIPAF